jgi:hypothetical protein
MREQMKEQLIHGLFDVLVNCFTAEEFQRLSQNLQFIGRLDRLDTIHDLEEIVYLGRDLLRGPAEQPGDSPWDPLPADAQGSHYVDARYALQ